jgi:hypothetical protein
MNRMMKIAAPAAVALALAACKEETTGPKGPSEKSTIVEVVSTVSKSTLGVGDTATFAYSVKNITLDTLTLTTNTGCQIAPVLDQVAGPRIPDLYELNCPTAQTVRVLPPGATYSAFGILRGYDKTKPNNQQTPGYLLTSGTFDASMVVTASPLPAPVRSDWVRFVVNVP